MMPHPKIIDTSLLSAMPLPDAGPEGSKADRGKLLIVAGSRSLPGAAILAARAALRVGCGTVRAAVPSSVAVSIGVAVPELMVIPLPETADGTASEASLSALEGQFERCDALVIGPGLGSGEKTGRLASHLVECSPLPTVVDAAALLAWGASGRPRARAPRVLTPHAGEMAALVGLDAAQIEQARERTAARYAAEWGAVVALKGRETLVAGADLYVNVAGTPGLGTAGSGDVLAGVIGGLLARGARAEVAAAWGVHIHARAGEAVADRLGDDGMTASDVVEMLPIALRSVKSEVEGRC
jgi:hydroxyethylthiazole kinase-like uncharacterized protein yjeF